MTMEQEPINPTETEHVPVPPLHRRPWSRSILLGFAILLSGIAIGAVGAAVVLDREQDRGTRRTRAPEGLVQRMQAEYDLTDAQAAKLEGIFKEHWERLKAIRDKVQPLMDEEFEALRREVESVLTPGQAQRWREEFERRQRYWRSRGGKSSGTDRHR
jgi:uncharacterized protein HemX